MDENDACVATVSGSGTGPVYTARFLRHLIKRGAREVASDSQELTPLRKCSRAVADWVNSVRELTQPRAVHWCEGSEAEARELTALLLQRGELKALNAEPYP